MIRRVSEHNLGKNSSAYTYSRRPVSLAYSSNFSDVWEAIEWEKRVKRWSRKKKEALIKGKFEMLPMLARNIIERTIYTIQTETAYVMVSTVEP